MNQKEDLYELPEWVKLVNRVLKGEKRLDDETRDLDKVSESKEAEV